MILLDFTKEMLCLGLYPFDQFKRVQNELERSSEFNTTKMRNLFIQHCLQLTFR